MATVVVLAYRVGTWTQKLGSIDRALNGNGVWQRKFDSTAKYLKDNRVAIEEVQKAFLAREVRCVEHAENIEHIKEKVTVIERRQERQSKMKE